ncbi:MAG TPA: protein translocase subunit SecD [Egibacteraceae bacterium]|nr:protein translocase subunit SecD [Egibacteraceae bacterium]
MGKSRLAWLLAVTLVVVAGMWGAILGMGLSPKLGLDLRGGITTTLIPAPGQGAIDQEVLDQTVQIIRQRIDGLGVAEPEIARQGDTILVQLPGVADREQAQEVIGRTAQLQFRPVLEVIPPDAPGYSEAGQPCDEALIGPPPADEDVVLCERQPEPGLDEPEVGTAPTKYRLAPVSVAGTDVADARAVAQQLGSWEVQLDLTGEGADRFAEVTGALACQAVGDPRRQLAIVLDDRVEIAPPVAEGVACGVGIGGGQATITIGGGEQEAKQLALVLRTGALPIQLDFATFQTVSPTLGVSSLQAGLQAGLIGFVLVALYMILLYRGMGIAAVAELMMFGVVTVGLIILLGEFAGFTLTLAGIAGIIVSIGIAADSSIIYRERYRDEMRAGRTVRTAADHAFHKAWRTNLTGNTVSFLAAVVLYWLAVGPVRGFAFTLGLSTLVDLILFGTFTRALFGLIARSPSLAASRLVGLRAGVPAELRAASRADRARRAKV